MCLIIIDYNLKIDMNNNNNNNKIIYKYFYFSFFWYIIFLNKINKYYINTIRKE